MSAVVVHAGRVTEAVPHGTSGGSAMSPAPLHPCMDAPARTHPPARTRR